MDTEMTPSRPPTIVTTIATKTGMIPLTDGSMDKTGIISIEIKVAAMKAIGAAKMFPTIMFTMRTSSIWQQLARLPGLITA